MLKIGIYVLKICKDNFVVHKITFCYFIILQFVFNKLLAISTTTTTKL